MKPIISYTCLLFFWLSSFGQSPVYHIWEHDGVIGGNGTQVYNGIGSLPELDPFKINIIILADGYDGSANGDYARFTAQKDAFINQFQGLDISGTPYSTPFYEYQDYFKIFWVWVHSATNNELGVGCIMQNPPNQTSCQHEHPCSWDGDCQGNVNTHFGSVHDVNGFHGLPVPEDGTVTVDMAQALFTNASQAPHTIVTLANTYPNNSIWNPQTYPVDVKHFGGGAYINVETNVGMCVVTRGTDLDDYNYTNGSNITGLDLAGIAVVHELGHSFAELLDEYWYDMSDFGGNEVINRTSESDITDPDHPWAHWYNQGEGIQVIDHVDYGFCGQVDNPNGTTVPDWHKPRSGECKMSETPTMPFCAVCREAIIEKIHELTRTITDFSFYDSNSSLPQTPEVLASDGEVFSLTLIEPIDGSLEVNWYVNNVLQETDTEAPWEYEFSCSSLSGQTDGTYQLKAVVRDNTPWVRSHLHSNHPYFNHDDHDEEQVWNIVWNGSGADLFVRDYDSDDGTEPTSGYPIDHSPDIVVKNNQMTQPYPEWGSATFLNDDLEIANSPAYIYIRVQNKGCEASDAGTLAIYTSIAGDGTSWDANWTDPTPILGDLGYQIGADAVSSIDGGSEVILEMDWDMVDLTGQPNWESCLLVRLEDFDDAINTQTWLSEWIWENNNIAMLNVSVVNMAVPPITEITGKPYAGGWTYTGNASSQLDTFNLKFDVDNDKISKNILDESEIIVYFEESGFDISGAILDDNLVGLTRIDSTLFRVTSDHARIDSIIVPADTLIPTYIGFAFLTEEVDSLIVSIPFRTV